MTTPDPRDPAEPLAYADRAERTPETPRAADAAPPKRPRLPGGTRPRRLSIWLVGAALLLVLAAAIGRLLAD